MCIVEAVTSKPSWLLSDDNLVEQYVSLGHLPVLPNEFSDATWDFVQRLCAYNPQERPSIIVVNELSYFLSIWLMSLVCY